ncbi:hypothetical protein BDR03DRAFT_986560 [Suillus americanus]|nr:hypothetical protein BDR03DRAFT_986560 [Suillus americanus]
MSMECTEKTSVIYPQKIKQKKLTEEEVLVLKSHLEEWKEAAANDRKKILKAVIKEAKVHAPAMDYQALKNRKYPTTKGVCALGLSEEASGGLYCTQVLTHQLEARQSIKDSNCGVKDQRASEKSTGKRTGRVEQVSSSEDEDKDDEDEEKDNNNEGKDDNNEERDDDNDEEKDNVDYGTLPPPKSKPVKNHLLVKKSRPVNTCSRASPAPSAAEHEDPHPPVKKSMPVPLPPKSKPIKAW